MKEKGYSDGIVRYPVSVVDHKKSSQKPVPEEVKEYVASTLNSMKMDEDTGDITLEYEDGANPTDNEE